MGEDLDIQTTSQKLIDKAANMNLVATKFNDYFFFFLKFTNCCPSHSARYVAYLSHLN